MWGGARGLAPVCSRQEGSAGVKLHWPQLSHLRRRFMVRHESFLKTCVFLITHNKTNCPQSKAVQGCWLWPRARRQQNICSCAATERCEREPDYRNSRNSRNTSFSLTGAGWAHSPPPSTVTHWSCVHQWICHTTTADNNNRSYYYLLITIFRVFTSVVAKNVHNK